MTAGESTTRQPSELAQPSTRAYGNGELIEQGFPLSAVSSHLERDGIIVWVDFCRPDIEQMHQLANELGLHALAVEDALGRHQRPKVDYYESHLFMACHAITVVTESAELESTEIDLFIHDRWLITVRKDESFRLEPLLARWDRSPNLMRHGVGFMLYTVLDVIVDDYFDGVAAFDEFFETVSDSLFAERPLEPQRQRHWFEMRRSLVQFHRLVVPMREAIGALMRHEDHAIDPELMPYFRDIYDHVLRVSESTDSLRELVATIAETNFSLREYRQNLIMKKVTSWAAIIAVPTLITGFYGMNVPFPGEGSGVGVVVALALMVALSTTLYLVFRARDWL